MEHALHQISESLDSERDSVAAAMEEENRLAAETQGQPEQEEAGSGQEPQPREEPEEADDFPEETEEPPVQEEEPEQTQEAASEAVSEPERYRVQKGDTLLEISRLRYGTDEMVPKICEINDLEDGDKIYVGETILLP